MAVSGLEVDNSPGLRAINEILEESAAESEAQRTVGEPIPGSSDLRNPDRVERPEPSSMGDGEAASEDQPEPHFEGYKREAAEQRSADLEVRLRERVLEGPIATLQVEDSEQAARLLEHLKLVTPDRGEELEDGEPPTPTSIEILLVEEARADADPGFSSWLAGKRVELATEVTDDRIIQTVLPALQERLPPVLAEPVGEALPLVSAISLSPAEVLLAVTAYGTLLELAGLAGDDERAQRGIRVRVFVVRLASSSPGGTNEGPKTQHRNAETSMKFDL
jgi:hypothetical protein